MTKNRKIELQDKIIRELNEENAFLTERIKELEKIVEDNQKNMNAVTAYRDEYAKCVASLNEAREQYLQSTKEMEEQKKKYKKDIDKLIKTIKKNI